MVLEKLVIPIGFDTGLLLQGLDFVKDAVEGVVGIAEQAVNRTREWAESLHELSDVTGMTGDTLAAWDFIVQKAGVDVGTFSRATVILEKGLYKADGTLDTTGKALTQFGISLTDANGKQKDASSLMDDIAKKYAAFGTQTERVDFLTNLFGRSGAQLIDVFDTLAKSGGIDTVKDKVKALGLVLDAEQYEGFQRTLNEIGLVFTGLANAFTGPLLPGAEKLVNLFKDWLESPWVANAISAIGTSLGVLLDDINIGLTSGDWSKFWGDATAIWDALKFKVEEALNLGLRWLYGNPTAITDFINGIITSLTTGVNNIEGSSLSVAAEEFISKIADQVAAADWGKLDLALGKGMEKAANNAFTTLWKTLSALMSNLWNYVTVPDGINYTPGQSQAPKKGGGEGGGGGGGGRRAAGGAAFGLTWVGERGPELVNLPRGSYVNNSQASASMGFDYYKFAAILALELAKAHD